jgi:hypothetical protein
LIKRTKGAAKGKRAEEDVEICIEFSTAEPRQCRGLVAHAEPGN